MNKRIGEITDDSLLPCPFCGAVPFIMEAGNDYTKKRSMTIRCPKCHCKRTVAAIRNTASWVKDKSYEKWNSRALPEE